MSAFRLLLAEIGYRRVNFVLCVLAVLVAATLFLAGPTLITAYSDETTRLVSEEETRTAEKLEKMRVRMAGQLKAKEEELDQELETLISENEAKLEEMQAETKATLDELEQDTKKSTRDLGFNLNIVHKDTTMGGLFMEHQLVDMPEEYIHKLAQAEDINMIRHLVATLQQKIKWNDRMVLLVGSLPEVHQAHMSEKPDMLQPTKPGTVDVGYELAKKAPGSDEPLKVGDTIQISGPGGDFSFEVAKILPEHSSQQDVMLAVHLHDAQKILEKPDRITQILALGCHCSEANLPNIREKLSNVLPDTNIREYLTKRVARAEMRDSVANSRMSIYAREASMCRMAVSQMRREHGRILSQMERNHEDELEDTEREGQKIVAGLQESRNNVKHTLSGLFRVTTPLVVIVSAAFVGLMLWNNVRERRQEIAVLRAIGKGAGMVAALVLGRALVLGLLGGVFGCLAGFIIARSLSVEFPIPLMVYALVGAPLVAILASCLPTRSAVLQDPAVLLQDQ